MPVATIARSERERRSRATSSSRRAPRYSATKVISRPYHQFKRLPNREKLTRFGLALPEQITVHLDAGYDSTVTRSLLNELGCRGVISVKSFPLQAGARWVVERTNSWHNRGFKKIAICTERRGRVIEAFLALANAVIITRRLLAEAWTTHRWDTRPSHRP